jgi:hypothetical protein
VDDGLLPNPSIDTLAKQVRMTHVLGIFPNQMDEHLTDGTCGSPPEFAEVIDPCHDLSRCIDLPPPRFPGLSNHLVVGGDLELVAKGTIDIPPRDRSLEPDPLNTGEVANEAQKGEVGRRDRLSCHGTGIEATALQLEREASIIEETEQHRSLVVVEPAIGTRIFIRVNEHVPPTEGSLTDDFEPRMLFL